MALGDITFIKGQGGLGRPLQGEDYISGLLFYTANGNLPSGWTTSARIRQLFSVADAENAGILDDYSDATAATGTYLITTAGSTGDTINIKVTTAARVINNNVASIGTSIVDLGTYTKVAGDSTIALLGASIAAFINANTYIHGFTASFTTATLTITAPKSQGTYLNIGTNLVVTTTGIMAGTTTQFSGGTQSLQAIWHYHIAEYFRMQPKGQLYVGFYAVPGTYAFTEITTMQQYAQGKIRQIGVYKDSASAYASGDLTLIHNEIVTNCDANHMPLSALYAADLSSTSDLSTLTNLNTLSAFKASAVISQDGAGLGGFLYATHKKSITSLGAHLGAVSFAAVSDSIEWIQKFNFSNGYELDVPAFANGVLVGGSTPSFINAIDNLRYLFLVKRVGNAGTFANHSYTAIAASSDYAYIENNRTIDKATRGIYASVLPFLGGPLVLNSDGTLTDETIAYVTSLAEVNLAQMVRDVELSDYQVLIDSAQDVLTTNTLTISVELLPIGVARNITVKIGFVVALTQ